MGLANPSNDENSASLEAPLAEFNQTRDNLALMQKQVKAYMVAVEAEFTMAQHLTFLHAPHTGDTAQFVEAALAKNPVHEALMKGMHEWLCAPLQAVLAFCDEVDALTKARAALVLDYDHHKRKLAAIAQRIAAAGGSGGGGGGGAAAAAVRRASTLDADEKDLTARQAKLDATTADLRGATTELLARLAALAQVHCQLHESTIACLAPLAQVHCQLHESVCRGLAACTAYRAAEAAAPLEVGGLLAARDVAECVAAMRACAETDGRAAIPAEQELCVRDALAAAADEARAMQAASATSSPRSATAACSPAAADAWGDSEGGARGFRSGSSVTARRPSETPPPPPPAAARGALFGRSLSTWDAPPAPVRHLVHFLDANALYTRFLFRQPGSAETVAELKRQLDGGGGGGGGALLLLEPGAHDAHDASALLKMFFRELPEPLFPAAQYAAALEAAAAPDAAAFAARARALLARAPPIHEACARLLFALLHRVNLCATDNKMPAENLGIVFAPNLLRSADAGEPCVADLQQCITFVRRMVEGAPEVFTDLWSGYPTGGTC
ncbi:Rho GTPase activation protein [Tribonema minus]|uniref:Rho GTPase activation protein n=1 Tax=Tribonema minus TaxID=303371 RepID=A0A836CHK5_9STRA|nr:Rho GTPase activation protein [Tribonema minus]